MLRLDVVISEKRRRYEGEAIVDTGMTGSLYLPRSVARRMRVTLAQASRLPSTATGETIPGRVAIVTVSIPEASVEAEVVAFVPDTADDEILLGYDFLAKVGAALTIGEAEYALELPRGHRRNARDDWRDVGNWVIPRHRPATPWE